MFSSLLKRGSSIRGPNSKFCNEKKTWDTGAEDACKLLLTMISSDTCRCLKSFISLSETILLLAYVLLYLDAKYLFYVLKRYNNFFKPYCSIPLLSLSLSLSLSLIRVVTLFY